jgi:hypothetical protein
MGVTGYEFEVSKRREVAAFLNEAGFDDVEVVTENDSHELIRCRLDGMETLIELQPKYADDPSRFCISVFVTYSLIHPLRSRRLFSRIENVLLAHGGRREI